MKEKCEIKNYLFEYIKELDRGNKSREVFDKYRKYINLCGYEDINFVIDKYIATTLDYNHIENIVAQFIRACERGIDSKEEFSTSNLYIKLLQEENNQIEKHQRELNQIYKDFVFEYKKTNRVDLNEISEFKYKLVEFKQINIHYLKLQNSLFPTLEKYSENMNCLKLMWHIQDEILAKLKELIILLEKNTFDFNYLNKLYGDMYLKIGKLIYREEHILYPLSIKYIPFEKIEDLLSDVKFFGVIFNMNLTDFTGGNNMSEIINNTKERKHELRKIIERINSEGDNKTIQKEIKNDFKKLLDTLSPEEIAEAEQSLIAEGVAVEEVQKLCELHVDTFHDALKSASKRASNRQDKISGHPIANYRAENKALRSKISKLKKEYKRLIKSNDFMSFDESLENLALIDIHYKRKENQLFPFLEQVDFSGPSKVMWAKHDEIRELIKKIRIASQKKDIQECVSLSKDLIPKLKRMIFMEEKILYPTALRKLPESVWGNIRKGETEIGYAWIKPGTLWAPEIISNNNINIQSSSIKESSLIDLSVGKLSASEINLMLTNLPIDITYVDENDKVRYFSQGKERLFPRSPGIIGRDVQNCHPPKSVHVVKKIVDDFKSGKRDSADFWIKMNGSFIYIRYFPLFEGSKYRGVIEVSQEISNIKSLEGEKRLLDEEK